MRLRWQFAANVVGVDLGELSGHADCRMPPQLVLAHLHAQRVPGIVKAVFQVGIVATTRRLRAEAFKLAKGDLGLLDVKARESDTMAGLVVGVEIFDFVVEGTHHELSPFDQEEARAILAHENMRKQPDSALIQIRMVAFRKIDALVPDQSPTILGAFDALGKAVHGDPGPWYRPQFVVLEELAHLRRNRDNFRKNRGWQGRGPESRQPGDKRREGETDENRQADDHGLSREPGSPGRRAEAVVRRDHRRLLACLLPGLR